MIALLLALSEEDKPMLVYWVIGAIFLIAQSLQGVVAVLTYFDRKKVDTTQFVTRTELNALRLESDQQMKDTFGYLKEELGKISRTVENLDRELREELPSIHRALGKLEGHDEREPHVLPPQPPQDKRSRRR